MKEATTAHQEIIIVRRGGGDDLAAPKGGSWKIAYADFVTAMMAFFLVMWLINSANEATKAKVASYFNPIKMTDTTPTGRGLKDAAETKAVPGIEGKSPGDADKPADPSSDASAAEDRMMADPQKALDTIAAEAANKAKKSPPKDSAHEAVDPFAPGAWQAQHVETAAIPPKLDDGTQLRPTFDTENRDAVAAGTEKDVKTKLEEELRGILAKVQPGLDIRLSVDKTREGLLIKLGDNTSNGMFAVGSAKPEASLIDLVGRVGALLKEQDGKLVVRGHTDSRPYRRGGKDNWQLSTARAHMASYMLIRGGFPEQRILSVEGHGAAAPLADIDPSAHANRRVEFLLIAPSQVP